ncbi:hypothetical protein RSAG8_07697, partial [Rhizoctonia solani AG-8 WAC10335]
MYSSSQYTGTRSARGGRQHDEFDGKPKNTNNVGLPPASKDVTWQEGSRIIVGIDIGSTHSGVAFAYLPKGGTEVVHRVTKWPGSSQSKIPTQIWYDKNGNAKSYGAEAVSEEAKEEAREKGWTLAQHFKLRLHPGEMVSKHKVKPDRLPEGVSLHRVYADFMSYLIENTKPEFEKRLGTGSKLWEEHRSNMLFVLAHPNGWGIRQQEFLRSAAVQAGLVDEKTSNERIRFVTEAEASVHYCINDGNIRGILKPGMRFAVCDAGGSTVDTTVYNVIDVHPRLKLEEEREPACIQAGGIYVDAAVRKYLERNLTEAKLSNEAVKEYTHTGVNVFEESPKRLYDGSENLKIRIGSFGLGFQTSEVKVYRGLMTIPGKDACGFFDICVQDIVQSIDEQIRGLDVSYILLVGGLGDSPYLQNQLTRKYETLDCELITANEPTSKAVAEGAVMWNTVTSVFRRRPRWSYGIQGYTRFDSQLDDHWERPKFTAADGYMKISGIWCEIVKKGVSIEADSVHREPFVRTYPTPRPNLQMFEIALYTYSGDDKPEWMRNKNGTLHADFEQVCLLQADLTGISGALESKIGPQDKRYWGVLFWVCVRFGDTEISAYLEWEEAGETRFGPISIVAQEVRWA